MYGWCPNVLWHKRKRCPTHAQRVPISVAYPLLPSADYPKAALQLIPVSRKHKCIVRGEHAITEETKFGEEGCKGQIV